MRKLTERLQKLNERLHTVDFITPGQWYFTDTNILGMEGNDFLFREPIVIRKAYSLRYVAENLPVVIKENEIIVGCPNQNSVEFGMCIPKYLTNEERDLFEGYGLSELSIYGHHPVAWEKIIQQGVIGLRQDIEAAIAKYMETESNDEAVLHEYRAMLLSLEALVLYANRYADEALRLALLCEDRQRREELLHVYKICRRVPLHPAASLQEVVQSYWFTYTILNSGGEFVPLARIDQYFYPYYEADMKKEKISFEDALDIIGCFLIKCNERVILDPKKVDNHRTFGYLVSGLAGDFSLMNKEAIEAIKIKLGDYCWRPDEEHESESNFAFGQEANNRMMTCVVGGVKPDGSDATNELSYMIIRLVHDMKLLMPTIGARIHKKTPKKFIELLATVLRHNQGEPIIYNDEAIIDGYERLGVPLEEARDYSSDGCWETLLPGKSNFCYRLIPNLKCLEWVLNRGMSVNNHIKESIDTGDLAAFRNFADFYEAYKTQMHYHMESAYEWFLKNLGVTAFVAPDPLFSALADDCVMKGKDIYDGGARYDFRMLIACGLADTADSLYVIKKLVYEEKRISLSELNEALHSNWQGYERLRALIVNKIEKFGNDDDGIDEMAARILRDFSDKIIELRSRSKVIQLTAGIGTFHIYALLGRQISASANGRYNYEAIAPNYSPVPGCDKNGPLSVIKSITKANLSELFAGTPVDISINKNEFAGEAGVRRLSDMILSFCDMGGQIMSITSNSVKELTEAKLHPEKYKNLRVRMGGLSAYFVALSPVQQDFIIKRFK